MTTPTLPRCLKCQRNMRPTGIRSHEAPGTVSTGARGYCGSCYSALLKSGDLSARQHRVNRADSPPVDQPDTPCVLVRIDLTPSTYKTLRRAGLNIGAELAKYATLMALQLEARNA